MHAATSGEISPLKTEWFTGLILLAALGVPLYSEMEDQVKNLMYFGIPFEGNEWQGSRKELLFSLMFLESAISMCQ